MDKERSQKTLNDADSEAFNYESFINIGDKSSFSDISSPTALKMADTLFTSAHSPQGSTPQHQFGVAVEGMKSDADLLELNRLAKRKSGKAKKQRQPRFQSRSAREHTDEESRNALNNRIRTKIHLKEMARAGLIPNMQSHPNFISPTQTTQSTYFSPGNIEYGSFISPLSDPVNGKSFANNGLQQHRTDRTPMAFSLVPQTFPFNGATGGGYPMISVTSSSSAPLTDQPQLGMVQQAFLSPSPIMTPIILSPPYMAAMYQQQPFMVDLQQQHQQLSDDQQSRLAVPQQQQQQQQTSPANSRRSSRRISKIPPVPPSLADIQFPKLMLNDHFISSDSPTSELAAPLSPQQQPRHRGSDAQYRSFQI